MTVTENKVITVKYTAKDLKGSVIDSSESLQYTHGQGFFLPFLEQSLEGKGRGDKFHVDVTPEAVDKSSKEANVFEIQKDKFSKNMTIKPGTRFKAALRGGIKFFTVKDIIENIITVDGMYPYADKTISFDIEILDIKE